MGDGQSGVSGGERDRPGPYASRWLQRACGVLSTLTDEFAFRRISRIDVRVLPIQIVHRWQDIAASTPQPPRATSWWCSWRRQIASKRGPHESIRATRAHRGSACAPKKPKSARCQGRVQPPHHRSRSSCSSSLPPPSPPAEKATGRQEIR